MSISEMTYVSYLFTIMAVVFGVVSVVLFFALDIWRCWQIVRGRHAATFRERVSPATVLNAGKREEYKKTEVLLQSGKTVPLETMSLVQDIVMIDAR